MSNADTREELAAALSTVDGVTGHARRPRAPRPGDAWPQWAGAERADGQAFLQAWNIIVVCSQGTADAADAFLDEHGDALADALLGAIFVVSMTPSLLKADGDDLYALTINGRTE